MSRDKKGLTPQDDEVSRKEPKASAESSQAKKKYFRISL